MSEISEKLEKLARNSLATYERFYEVVQDDWRSLCERNERFEFENQTVVEWRPYRRELNTDLDGLSEELHPDLRDYYESFWSGGIEATHSEGPVSLLQIWNAQDLVRLKENLVGHLMAKKALHLPLTGFFACTSPESDFMLSVDTARGWVVLEKPGYRSKRRVADSLAEFLDELHPAEPWHHPERVNLEVLWQKKLKI